MSLPNHAGLYSIEGIMKAQHSLPKHMEHAYHTSLHCIHILVQHHFSLCTILWGWHGYEMT